MAIATITTGSWQTVTTTVSDTVIQNQSPREVYIFTGSTAALPSKSGYLLAPWVGSVVVSTGFTVSAYAHGGSADIFYMNI